MSIHETCAICGAPGGELVPLVGNTIVMRHVDCQPRQATKKDLMEIRVAGWVALYESGLGCYKIARRFSVPKHRVIYYLRRAGVAMRPNKRRFTDGDILQMYAEYEQGMTTREIGKKWRTDTSMVGDYFRAAGFVMRSGGQQPKQREDHPPLEWNGNLYTWHDLRGRYRRTSSVHTLLHIDVWTFHNGPIPPGHVIRHRDGDATNNDIANLEYVWFRNPPRPVAEERHCRQCGDVLTRKRYRCGATESWVAFARRLYCSHECAGLAKQGKPWSANRRESAA